MIEQTALATLLEARLIEWDKARKGQESKLLDCYQDVMRIARDEDTAGTGAAKAKKAKSLFMGSTRNKVRSARAKINDALFGNGEMPFDTTPTNEELAKYADTVEDILTEQFERMKLKDLLSNGVNTLATYGTGFIFGPFVRKEKLTETYAEQAGKSSILKESKYEFDHPYFELGNTLDVFPDPEARVIEDGLGVFWVTMMSPHTIRAWKTKDGYKHVESALLAKSDNGTETGSARAEQLRGNLQYWHKNDRVKVARYFGKIPKNSLSVWNSQTDVKDDSQTLEDQELIDAIVIMAGGVVVKVDENPYQGCRNPTLRCVYEAVEHEIWGVGVAENNAPHQKVTNAAFRLFMEGKGMALLGTATVDRSKFLPSEDFKKFPGKVYQTKPGLTPEERKEAIIHHTEPDITGGWLDVIRMSEQFSDDDTGINKYTQGDDSQNLNKTAHGISMIMSASSLPLKEVIHHIDSMWIEEIVERTIEWDLKFLDVDTVEKIHGKEAAQLWAEIKQFGKTSFMDWQATGTSSFMQKEVLVGKIRAFSEFALSNPITAPLIDGRELLNQTWMAMEVGKESPVLEDPATAQIPPHVQQIMAQKDQQLAEVSHALETAHSEHVDLENKVKAGADVQNANNQALDLREEAKHRRQVEFETVKLDVERTKGENARLQEQIKADAVKHQAMLDADLKLQIEREKIASAEKIASEANAITMLQLAASQEQAKQAKDAEKTLETGKVDKPKDDGMATVLKHMKELSDHLNSPATLIRDASGRATGIQRGKVVKSIQRDGAGRATGIQ